MSGRSVSLIVSNHHPAHNVPFSEILFVDVIKTLHPFFSCVDAIIIYAAGDARVGPKLTRCPPFHERSQSSLVTKTFLLSSRIDSTGGPTGPRCILASRACIWRSGRGAASRQRARVCRGKPRRRRSGRCSRRRGTCHRRWEGGADDVEVLDEAVRARLWKLLSLDAMAARKSWSVTS
jgi:hypothetical protein